MKFKYIILASFLALFSCEGFMDKTPLDKVSEASFYQTDGDFIRATNAIYSTQQSYWRFTLDGSVTPNGYGNGDWRDANIDAYSGVISSVWNENYNTIAYANIVLEEIEGKDITDDVRKRCIGEATFLRAFAYFELAMYFGDVPLITELPKTVSEYHVEKNDQEEIFAQVLSDLNTAEQNLPSVTTYRGTDDIGRVSLEAAKMLKVRYYMWHHEYENAANKAYEIIETNNYQILDDYHEQFWLGGDNTDESLFEVQYQVGIGEGTRFNNYLAPAGSGYTWRGGYGPLEVSASLVNEFEVNANITPDPGSTDPYQTYDPRLRWTALYQGTPYSPEMFEGIEYQGAWAQNTSYSTVKYILGKNGTDVNDSPKNMILMRYADLLLMHAEAQNEMGDQGTAAQFVNMVRQRPNVNLPPLSATLSQSEMREAIKHERRVELGMEGVYYFDLLRWGDYLNAMDEEYPGVGWNSASKYLLWPIPQTELDKNPNLVQNPDYM
jgi:effector-binding domain-containing protein